MHAFIILSCIFTTIGAKIVIRDYMAQSSGPVFLSELYCSESDTSLEECDRGIVAIGLAGCDHGHDVKLTCKGKS